MSTLHIHRPTTIWARRIMFCPTCKCRRRFVGMMQVWYDTTWTCCSCGDAWAGEERLPRPFARGWRAESSARARKRWPDARHINEASRKLIELYDIPEPYPPTSPT